MYVRTFIQTYAHTPETSIHSCVRTNKGTDTRTCKHAGLHARMHACTHARMHTCTHAHMHARMHAHRVKILEQSKMIVDFRATCLFNPRNTSLFWGEQRLFCGRNFHFQSKLIHSCENAFLDVNDVSFADVCDLIAELCVFVSFHLSVSTSQELCVCVCVYVCVYACVCMRVGECRVFVCRYRQARKCVCVWGRDSVCVCCARCSTTAQSVYTYI